MEVAMDVERALKIIGKDTFKESVKYLETLTFGVVKLKNCNGVKSTPFSKAECEFYYFGDGTGIGVIRFADMFRKGMVFLKEMENVNEGRLEGTGKAALLCLGKFFDKKDSDEESLNRVFTMKTKNDKPVATETDITVALAEHLLKKLAPGGSYKVDADSKQKRPCLCGCTQEPNYSPTGMGNSSVWYGFIDIIFTSPYPIDETQEQTATSTVEDIPAIATAVEVKEEEEIIEDSDKVDDQEDSPKMITEVKKVIPDELLQQALAQTIVFSWIQRKRHPERSNHMVPNIVISPKQFKIMMYDAGKDVFLVSTFIDLFTDEKCTKLSSNAVIVLWMVLHNRLFCTGFDSRVDSSLLEKLKSDFITIVDDKLGTYIDSLDYFVSKFNPEKKPSLNDSLNSGHEIDLYERFEGVQLDDTKADA